MSGHRDLIDREMRKLLPRDSSKLSRAMRYSIFAGGKRFRPMLMIETALCCGGKIKDVLAAACAVEMIHTFTLIHDDLPAMDNSDLRRGRPTCHKVFGEDIAILAGDALNTLAFEVLAKNYDIMKLAIELSEALIKVVRGQVQDLEAEGKKITYDQLRNIHLLKTAALIEASVKMGAVLAGAGRIQIKALTGYARHLGLAFQIADDILDAESTSSVLGKPAKADQKNKKATYPAILGLKKAAELAEKNKNAAVNELKSFGSRADVLRSIAEFAVRRKK
ncbi:MAG: polyprenyl synthetase family protein [Candidatus Margulisiibacteriota bacterium]